MLFSPKPQIRLSQSDKDLLNKIQSIILAAKPHAAKGEFYRYYATFDSNGNCYPSDNHSEFGIILPRRAAAEIDWMNTAMDEFFARHGIETSTFLYLTE